MDKSRLQKKLRSKLEQPQQAAATKNTKPSVQADAKAQKPLTSALQEKIESSITDKKKVATDKNAGIPEIKEDQRALQMKAALKAKKTPKVKPKKKKVKPIAQTKTYFKSLKDLMPLLSWYIVAIIIVLVDQMTKELASSELMDASPLILTSWLQFDLTHNPGAAFSLFADAGGWQRPFLVLVSLAVSIFIAIWLARLPSNLKILPLALALVLGGAVGNLVDRAMTGYVVDFISFHYEQLFFPSFNIADTAISCGAFLLFLDIILSKEQVPKEPIPEPPEEDGPLDVLKPGITADELLKQADAKKAAAR